MESEQISLPRYLKIAVDICARIASNEIHVGEKLKGRSILASEYNVSPETIRRSMSILSDKGVVDVVLGSGILILSKENAIQFIRSFKDDESVAEMRKKLNQMLDDRKSLDDDINILTNQIIDMYKYKRTDAISPVEILIPPNSHVIGQSIGSLEIWHNTGATIIGIIQDKRIIISPGPYYEFSENDRVIIVGDENVIERFNVFINGI